MMFVVGTHVEKPGVGAHRAARGGDGQPEIKTHIQVRQLVYFGAADAVVVTQAVHETTFGHGYPRSDGGG